MLATAGPAVESPPVEEERMSDYEAPEADVLEQEGSVADDTAPVDLEAPEADAAEQAALAGVAAGDGADTVLPYDANEADAAEQSRVVELDDDDYR